MFKFYSREKEGLKEVKKKEIEVGKDYIIVQILKEDQVRTRLLFLTLSDEDARKELRNIMKTFFPYDDTNTFPEVYKNFVVTDYMSFKRSVEQEELNTINRLTRTYSTDHYKYMRG